MPELIERQVSIVALENTFDRRAQTKEWKYGSPSGFIHNLSIIKEIIKFVTMLLFPLQTQGRESIAAKLVANLITMAGADRVLACDIHSGQSIGYFDIPVDHVYCEVICSQLPFLTCNGLFTKIYVVCYVQCSMLFLTTLPARQFVLMIW
jgi:hypothetical protein